MQFSIRFLMLLIVAISLCIGLPLSRQMARKREVVLAKEISVATPYHGIFDGGGEVFARKFDRETLLELYRRYARRNDETARRISRSAIYHLARRKDPEGLRLCKLHLSDPHDCHLENPIHGVLAFYELSDDIHQTQNFGASIADGFSVEAPDDVYLVGTLICSEFHFGNGAEELMAQWPSADKLVNSWLSPGQSPAISYASYDDIVNVVEKFDKEAAEHFREIVRILHSCNGSPDEEQRRAIHEHGDKFSERFVPRVALLYLARNSEFFARNKLLQAKPR